MAWASFLRSLTHLLISCFLLRISMGDPRTSLVGQFCNDTSSTNADILANNFVSGMNNLSSMVNANGFGIVIVGVNPNAVYALAQCYGDLSSVDCKLCFSEIRSQLPKCYPNTGGILFLDGCFGRYENYSFFNEIFFQNDSALCSFSNNNSNPNIFGQTVRQVIRNVSLQSQNNQGFAVGSASFSNVTVYALAQCWKNLNSSLCSSCLDAATSTILSCSPATEGRALYAGCFMRYSTSLFWNVNQTSSSSNGLVRKEIKHSKHGTDFYIMVAARCMKHSALHRICNVGIPCRIASGQFNGSNPDIMVTRRQLICCSKAPLQSDFYMLDDNGPTTTSQAHFASSQDLHF